MPHYLNTEEVSKILRKSKQSLWKYVKQGKLSGVKIGNRLFFTEDEIRNFIHPVGGKAIV